MQHGLILHTIRYMHYSYWKCTFHTVDHGNNFTYNRVQSKWPSKGDMHILTMYIHVHTYLHVHERHTHTGSTIRTNTRLRTSLDSSLERSDRSCDITTSFSTTVCSRSLIC